MAGALGSLFNVVGNGGSADLCFANKKLSTIKRPSKDSFLKDQLTYLRSYADLRADRIGEISIQLGDLISFFGAQARLDSTQARFSGLILHVVQALTIQLELRVKHKTWTPRPIQYSENVQPIVQTPSHSSFPNGHATEAFAIATVLHQLATNDGLVSGIKAMAMPFRLAHRIAVNRVIAGVHFPVDCGAGALLGTLIGHAAVVAFRGGKRLKADFEPGAATTSGTAGFGSGQDFLLSWLDQMADVLVEDADEVTADPILQQVWLAARKEWGYDHA